MSGKDENELKKSVEETALERRVDLIMNSAGPVSDIRKPQTAQSLAAKLRKPSLPTAASPPQPTMLPLASPAPLTPKPISPSPAWDQPMNAQTASLPDPKLDDPALNAALDQIEAQDRESRIDEEEFAIPPAGPTPKSLKKVRSNSHAFYRRKLFWFFIILCLIGACLGVPYTRYHVLDLFLRETYQVVVIDSKTHTAVSNALVQLGGVSARTDASGDARLRVKPGPGELSVSKEYYQVLTKSVTVGVVHQSAALKIDLFATGRQIPLHVSNAITGLPLAGVEISVKGTTVKTNSAGSATVVLPTTESTYQATVSDTGYQSLSEPIDINSTSQTLDFKLVPSGKIYYLTNASGTINVDSSNLDGSDQQIVLAGTGNENVATTKLINSSDWKYLALIAHRTASTSHTDLYLINTQNDNSLITVDSGNYTITPIGWSGHYFLYEAQNLGLASYQSGQYLIKSYDADTGHLSILDQSAAAGDSSSSIYQTLGNFTILSNDILLYTKQWQGSSSLYSQGNYVSSIDTIGVNGQDQAPLQQFTLTSSGDNVVNIVSETYAANKLYFEAYFSQGDTQFYNYSAGTVSSSSISQAAYSSVSYVAGVSSPSGQLAAFSGEHDGQFQLSIGQTSSSSQTTQKVIATLSNDYAFYAWFSDSYILLSYKGQTLYAIPTSGLINGIQPYKISNYLN